MQVVPYLLFNGQCEAAFNYYAQHLNGTIVAMMPHEGTPAAAHVSADWQKKILHARMMIGEAVLMASDAPPGRYGVPQGMAVSLLVEDAASAERIFQALATGGSVTMPIQETFFAVRFGMVTDMFGIPWMITCEKPM